MRCEGCGAEVLLGSASCASCGRSLLPASTPDLPPDQPTTQYLPPPPVPVSFDAPPPPPLGWTIEDGPGRAALLPPHRSPKAKAAPDPKALKAPTNKGAGCGCAAAVVSAVIAMVAAIGGIVAAASSDGSSAGDRIPAPALTLGSVVPFGIGTSDTAVHPLSLGEGAVTVTVTSLDDDFDPVLRIVDDEGTEVGRNDDADGLDSRLSFTLGSSATFDVEVSEFSGDAGSYEVAVRSGATPPQLEPVDPTVGEHLVGEDLVLDDAIQRHLGQDDVVSHHLDGFEGRVTITVTGLEDFDPVVTVLDADGGVVAENDDHDGLDSLVTFVLSPDDDLDVQVTEFSGDPGFYSILLQRGDGESGGPPVLGEALERGSAVDGEVGREQRAIHDFTGDGEEVVVRVQGQLGFDPVVRVVSAAGDELVENDDTDGRDSRVELTIAADETVTIEVRGYGGQPGSYKVLVG